MTSQMYPYIALFSFISFFGITVFVFMYYFTCTVQDEIMFETFYGHENCNNDYANDYDNSTNEKTNSNQNYEFKYEHLKKYIDWSYHLKYSPSREKLQEKIIDSHFIGKQKQSQSHAQLQNFSRKKIIFTGGCYGAGKSNVLKQLQKENKINLDNFVHVDQDKMRSQIPEYETYLRENYYTAGFKTNKETGYIAELIQLHAMSNGYNLIVDSSLTDAEWLKQYIDLIRSEFSDYEIIIIYVKASWERILERNIRRGEVTRRVIPFDCLLNAYEKSPVSFEFLKNYVNKWYVIENDYKENEIDYERKRSEQFKNIDFMN